MKILVLNARALHLGYLRCYGCDWVATPHLDQLAADSVVFDQHFADCPKHRSASLTGRYHPPLVSRALEGPDYLATLLNSHGLPSIFADCFTWDQVYSVSRSFIKKLKPGGHGLGWLDLPSLTSPWSIADKFLENYFFEVEGEEEPLIPWLDPPIGPVSSESSNLGRLQNTYAAVVSQFDACLGKLIDQIARLQDQFLLIVTAESGLALGEHGYVGEHRAWLHEEIWHVPLLMRFPGQAEAGRRMSGLTQSVDLFATLFDALELPAPVNHGFSLLPMVRGEAETIRPYVCAGLKIGETSEWALRTPDWLMLLPRQGPAGEKERPPQLFVKPDDRWEVNDVRHHHLKWAEGLEKTLREFAAAAEVPGPLEIPPLPIADKD